jgi:hypothetical protein
MKWKIKAMLFSTTNQLRGSLGLTPDASEKKSHQQTYRPLWPGNFRHFPWEF